MNATGARVRISTFDWPLFWVVAALMGFGLVMVYSASIAIAGAKAPGPLGYMHFLIRQAGYLTVGTLVGMVAFRLPMERWQALAPTLFIAGIALLALVLIPHIGREVNGSRRWIGLAIMNLQPSEFMKLFAALYAADYTVRKAAFIESFTRGFAPMLVVMLFIGFLLLREPDFGAFATITAISMGILFLGGVNARQFGFLALMFLIGFAVLIVTSPYRWQRVTSYMDPWRDPFGSGYQLSHALIAFGRGEWLGVGLGASVEKLFYLPEAHTDFLMAVIAEELGFVGVVALICMFAWVTLRAFSIARACEELELQFSALVCYGIGVWLAVQAAINMGVNMGLLPTKGLTLPFLSYGGSGIVANCIAVALLLRADWEARLRQNGYRS